jgi:hypothetical protein
VERLSAWVGAGLVTSGVLAAMIAGAAVAVADTDSPSDGGGATSSGSASAKPESTKPESTKPESTKPESTKPGSAKLDTKTADAGADVENHVATMNVAATVSAASAKTTAADHDSKKDDDAAAAPTKESSATYDEPTAVEEKSTTSVAEEPIRSQPEPAAAQPDPAPPKPVVTPDEPVAPATVASPTALRSSSPVVANVVAPPQPTVVGLISSVVFNVLQTVERIVTGPPVLPPNSTVTVRSSTLTIGDGVVVPADWYYPAGEQPTQLILLQHGFLAIGPMYSYTAANLAERTHSIVVVPTLTSNPLADGGFWLGGAGMHQAVANLFLGQRDALTASALAAGYAQQYVLDPATVALPRQFALAGHSLGGALVSGVAGYLADNGAADQLVGVILLDGVPTGDQLPGALVKLAAYEELTGHYVPVREIGAPWNVWNSLSNANQALTAARPDNFNGVVLAGGVHMDSMQGGNPLIQFAAYLAAGFPEARNPPAVQQLAVTWLDQWFAGDVHIGDRGYAGYLVPGSTIEIGTPAGPARGVVIGNPPAVVATSPRERQLVA